MKNMRSLRNNCPTMSCPRLPSEAARVTMIPVAVEISNAGIWLTNPSPTVNSVYVCNESTADMSRCAMPIMKPPPILISMITIAAIASPLTNFEAPSIAPKKSASR